MMARPAMLLLAALAACSRAPSPQRDPVPAAAAGDLDRDGALVTLERTPCFGTCPVYQVSVAGDGTVEFVGKRFVTREGPVTAQIAPARVDSLLRALDRGGFFGFADLYVTGAPACGRYATDSPTVITSVTAGGRTKTIRHDYGCSAAPAQLTRLERLIDEIAGTGRWTGR